MPLRIAHILSYPYHGGIQEYVVGLAKAQMRLGHSVTIFTSGQQAGLYSINFINKKPLLTFLRNPISFDLAFEILKSNMDSFDVFHIHLPFPLTGDLVVLLTALLRRRHSYTIIATYHFDIALESFSGRLMAPIYNHASLGMTLNNVDKILVSSKTFSERSPVLLKHQEKICMVPMGIDTEQYLPSYDRSSQVVFVGRIIPEKGIHYLINSLKYLEQKTRLVIIGKIVEKQYYNSLVNLSHEIGIGKRVSFTGAVSHDTLHDYYRSAEVVVLPSTTRLESFGLTLLEAMAMGKPIISTNVVPGAVELIRKSKCGLIVPPRDPLALAEAIKTLSNSSVEFGSKARDYVKLFHDWGTVAQKIDDIYDETLAEIK